jgi:alkylresorcinol/alkylpyrone synthase
MFITGLGTAVSPKRYAQGECWEALFSATLYFDDDPGVLISACLFGDGAGAAVLGNSPAGKRPVKWMASGSLLQPKSRDLLRFEHKDGMLRNVLSLQVPAVAAQYAATVLDAVLLGWCSHLFVAQQWE